MVSVHWMLNIIGIKISMKVLSVCLSHPRKKVGSFSVKN